MKAPGVVVAYTTPLNYLKRRYILNNPVRAGLVVDGEAWPFQMDRFETR